MRVTENAMTRTVLNDVMGNRGRLSHLQEKLSSGYDINRPSDDPGGTSSTMQLTSTLSELDQFKSNSDRAHDWLAATESALNESTDTVGRVRELTVQAASGSLSEQSYEGIREEVDALTEHLVSLGNSRHSGRYLFSGHQTDEAPYDIDELWKELDEADDPEDLGDRLANLDDGGGMFRGDEGTMTVEVGPGVELDINVSGAEAFDDIIETCLLLRKALEDPEENEIGEYLSDIDDAKDEILSARSRMGGRMNRLELNENRLEELDESVQRVLSETRDADIAEVVMHLATAERAYHTSLATGARILPQTLLDHLR